MKLRERFGDDHEVAIGVITLAVFGVIMFTGLTGILPKLFGSEETRVVRAVFANSQQLTDGDTVRIDGVKSGLVKRLELDEEAGLTTVYMDVEERAGSLYDNASATVRFKTVLGGSFYVDLERGTPNRPPLGKQAIPPERTGVQVEVDDLSSVIKGGAQEGLRILPGELADAFRDHQAPRRLLDTIHGVARPVTKGLNALRGKELDRDLQGLLRNTSRTVRALDTPRDDVRTVISGGAATLQTTAARDAEIRTMLEHAPGAEREVDATLTRLRTTLDLADPLIAKLQGPARRVAPTFSKLRPALGDANRLLRRARPLLRALRPAARSLAGTARRGLPLVNELTPSIERTEQTILPALAEVDEGTQKSTAVMIGGTFTGLASGAGGQMDSNGHFIRFQATTGSNPFNSMPCAIYFANPDAEQVLACQSLQQAFETYFNYDPIGSVPGTEPPGNPRRKRR